MPGCRSDVLKHMGSALPCGVALDSRSAWAQPWAPWAARFARIRPEGWKPGGKKVDDNLALLNDGRGAMQRGMRVMAIGIDYARYNRFVQLTPKVFGTGEDRRVDADFDYAPTRQEYDDCVQFVVAAALRLAELEADAAQPSWRRARFGGPA